VVQAVSAVLNGSTIPHTEVELRTEIELLQTNLAEQHAATLSQTGREQLRGDSQTGAVRVTLEVGTAFQTIAPGQVILAVQTVLEVAMSVLQEGPTEEWEGVPTVTTAEVQGPTVLAARQVLIAGMGDHEATVDPEVTAVECVVAVECAEAVVDDGRDKERTYEMGKERQNN